MTHGELLKECLILDRVTDAFAVVVMSIAENTINSHWQTRECGRQDALSRFYEKFMKKWKSINPEKNVAITVWNRSTETFTHRSIEI